MTPITDLLTPVSVWAAILGGAALATLVISETTDMADEMRRAAKQWREENDR